MHRRIFTVALFLFTFVPVAVWASPASTDVEISDRAYRDIEKLVSYQLVFPPMIDERPLSRSEFARLVAEANKTFESQSNSEDDSKGFESFSKNIARRRSIRGILKRLIHEFNEELIDTGAAQGEHASIRIHGLEELRLDGTLMSSAPLTIMPNNGVGTLSARVTPLWDYREGRHPVDGFQMAAETIHRAQFSKYFSVLAHPRLEGDIYRSNLSGQDDIEILLQEGYGVLQVGDAALKLGRSSVMWGPAEHGGLTLTGNARPLDLIKFSTPSPFRLPWVFSYLGRFRVALFGANLGPDQTPRYPWLTGWRLSYMPWRYLELGVGNVTMMGGEGAPHLTAIDIIGEFFGFRPAGTSGSAVNKTNHIMEASFLVRIPKLAGMQFYGVIANDDKRDTIKRFLRDGSSYLTGVYFPRLNSAGTSDLRLEFRRMCAIAYRHSLYVNGYTLDGLFIGDDLGPDALGFSARFNQDFSNAATVSASFNWEVRRGDTHTTTIDPDGTLGDVIVSAEGPHEQRFRFGLEPRIKISEALELRTFAGYERVLNAGYIQGVSRNNLLGAVSLRINLDRHFRFEAL